MPLQIIPSLQVRQVGQLAQGLATVPDTNADTFAPVTQAALFPAPARSPAAGMQFPPPAGRIDIADRCISRKLCSTGIRQQLAAFEAVFGTHVVDACVAVTMNALNTEMFFERFAEELAKTYDSKTLQACANVSGTHLGKLLDPLVTESAAAMTRAAQTEFMASAGVSQGMDLLAEILGACAAQGAAQITPPTEAPEKSERLSPPTESTLRKAAQCVDAWVATPSEVAKQSAIDAVAHSFTDTDLDTIIVFIESPLGQAVRAGRAHMTEWTNATYAEPELSQGINRAMASVITRRMVQVAKANPPDTSAKDAMMADLTQAFEQMASVCQARLDSLGSTETAEH